MCWQLVSRLPLLQKQAAKPKRVVSCPIAAVMAASGGLMLAMDLRAGRMALRELAGAFVLLKLLMVAWMAFDPGQAHWIFWLLLVGSSIASHAPKGFRHWPTRRRG